MAIDRYRGAINPNAQIYDPSAGMGRLTESPSGAYAPYGAQATFDDTYRAMGQKAAMDLSRGTTQAQNAYYNQAADFQNRGALQGLQLLGQQRSNAYDRQNAAENMQYKWMQDMFRGGGNLLGGLL
jgi:hypothetical protein